MHRGKHALQKFAIATPSWQTNAEQYIPPGIQEGNVPAVTIRDTLMTAGAYDYLRLKSDVLIEWGIEANTQ